MTATATCLVAWGVVGSILLGLLRRDYSAGKVETRTAFMIWLWHGLNYALLVLFATESVWALSLPGAAHGIGIGLLVAGLAVIAAGFYEFRSVQRLTGTRQDQLIDSGIYRFSRHPQYLGIILTLIGIALAGDSGAALLFALVLSATFIVYLPFEERYVAQAFGAEYERYRKRVPMLLG